MTFPTPSEINAMSVEARKALAGGDFARMLRDLASTHVTWLFWAEDTDLPTAILGHGSAFMLDRGRGAFLVTAGHVYREYRAHQRQYGALRCQVANVMVRDLTAILIDCGDLNTPYGEREHDADIATFRLPPHVVTAIGKVPIPAHGKWPVPPVEGQQVMYAGYPGQERIVMGPGAINFGFHSGMTGARVITDREIKVRIERGFMVDNTGNGLPPAGYGLGGVSGGPLLVPEYGESGWYFRLGGVISQATEERPPEEVLIEMVVAHRAEFIQPDGRLAKIL